MPEASTTKRPPTQLVVAGALSFLAAGAWVAAAFGTFVGELPDRVSGALLLMAGVTTLGVVGIGGGYARLRTIVDALAGYQQQIVVGQACTADRIRELTDAAATGAAQQEQLAAKIGTAGVAGAALVDQPAQLAAQTAVIGELSVAVQQISTRLDEAIAAAYRRGLVHGAQQLATDGRPPLRPVESGN